MSKDNCEKLERLFQVGQIYKETKWLIFQASDFKPEKGFMHVVSKSRAGLILGYIGWYSQWRQYTFEPEPFTTFNNACLQDITDVLTELNKAQKKGKSS